jgi:hypothetical protein
VNPASARGLVPPRPNLGPEPWSESQPIPFLFVAVGILICLLVVSLAWRRLGRRWVGAPPRDLPKQGPLDASPKGRLVAHSDSIRDVLASQFGNTWRAKTIEELSLEARLTQVLGRDQLDELIRFLDQVDRLKFAPARSNRPHQSLEHDLATWEPRLDNLKKKINSIPKGQSKTPSVLASPGSTPTKPAYAQTPSTNSRPRTWNGRSSIGA